MIAPLGSASGLLPDFQGPGTVSYSVMRRDSLVWAALGFLLAGCAWAGRSCERGRTGGWFSGWGSGGSGAFTLGVRRTWDECDASVKVQSRQTLEPLPAPSVGPPSEPPVPR